MGTIFHLVFFAQTDSVAEYAASLCFARIDSLNQRLSDYLPTSELNQLCTTAGKSRKVKVSPDLWNVLVQAQWFARKSRGAFDVTVGPLTRLWRRAIRKQAIPEPDKMKTARAVVGYKNLKLYTRTQEVLLKQAGMKLDLGGIAKGYTVDQTLQVLYSLGIQYALVDGGGDIAMGLAPPSNTKGWKIQIASVDSAGELVNTSRFYSNCAIATSGDTYRFLEIDGTRYSHIIDPRTGMGLTHRLLVSIIADNCTTADAMASTASVLSKQESQTFINRNRKLKRTIQELTISEQSTEGSRQ